MDASTAKRFLMLSLLLMASPSPAPQRSPGLDFGANSVAAMAGQRVFAQPRLGGRPRTPPKPPAIEFRGWDYQRLGQGLSPGEDMSLIFLNNLETSQSVPVSWTLTTYAGAPLGQGKAELELEPGQTGELSIPLV